MMTYREKHTCPILLQQVPGFLYYWNEELNFWGEDAYPDNLSSGGMPDSAPISTLSTQTIELLERPKNHSSDLEKIFKIAEGFLVYGDEELQNSIVVNFLENILNACPEKYEESKVKKYLWPKSRFEVEEQKYLWKENLDRDFLNEYKKIKNELDDLYRDLFKKKNQIEAEESDREIEETKMMINILETEIKVKYRNI